MMERLTNASGLVICKDCPFGGRGCDDCAYIADAIARLTAYEDEAEQRDKGCGYCNKREILIKYGVAVYIEGDTLALFDNEDGATAYKKIAHCPICGRKLV